MSTFCTNDQSIIPVNEVVGRDVAGSRSGEGGGILQEQQRRCVNVTCKSQLVT